MSPSLLGASVGLLLAVGVLLIAAAAPPLHPIRLHDRLGPYVQDAPAPSRLLDEGAALGAMSVARRLLSPLLGDAVRFLDRVVGGRGSVRRRLAGLPGRQSVEDFRIEQVVWGAGGLAMGVGAAILLAAGTGQVNAVSALLLCVGGAIGGVLGRDWWLSRAVTRRKARMLAEFPVVAELLALAVTAGEGPLGAIDRVSTLTGGELGQELAAMLAQSRAGLPLVDALQGLADRTALEPLARFVDGVIVALERGTPLADVLRAQAADVREGAKRELLAAGGRKEIAMMLPVVFLVLPVTVLFALYPGLVSIVRLAQ